MSNINVTGDTELAVCLNQCVKELAMIIYLFI